MNDCKVNIAVIIPTCDRPEFLKESIASVRSQTLTPAEIIICDNGYIQEILFPLRENEFHIKLTAKVGASAARNAGLFLTEQEFVAFLDDDDIWHPRFLEMAHKRIQADGADCVFGRRNKLVEGQVNEMEPPEPRHLVISYLICKNPFFGGQNILLKSAIAKALGGYDINLPRANDTGFLIDLLLYGAKVSIEPEAVAYFRDHGGPRVTSHHWRRWRLLWKYAGNVPLRDLAIAIIYFIYGGTKKMLLRSIAK